MAHYAFIKDNIVTEVITGIDEDVTEGLPEGFADWEAWYADFRGQTCKRTSYNTSGNEHSGEGTPFRGNYAGIGYTYDSTRDAFIPPKPFASWVLNEDTCIYDPPVAYPTGDSKSYIWDESVYQADNTKGWVEDT